MLEGLTDIIECGFEALFKGVRNRFGKQKSFGEHKVVAKGHKR